MTHVFARTPDGKLARWESPDNDHQTAIADVAALGESVGPILALIVRASIQQLALPAPTET